MDVETANIEVRRWLWSVVDERCHGTTGEVLRLRWEAEREKLLKLPPQHPERVVSTKPEQKLWRSVPPLQHPLSVYDELNGVA